VLGAAVVWAATIVIANSRNAEYDWFKNTYGPNRHSEHAEEWIIRDFFHDQRGGIFLDIGSYDYKRFSNTYYLEQELGWSGVAVDAQQEFAAGYAQYRPRTKFFSFFVSDRSDALESLFVPSGNRLVASSNKSFSDRYDTSGQERTVSTITLNDLLPRAGVTRVDFLSMDVRRLGIGTGALARACLERATGARRAAPVATHDSRAMATSAISSQSGISERMGASVFCG